MIRIVDVKALGIPAISLGVAGADASCSRCAAHSPEPDVNGNLRVDPEIRLPSPEMDVEVAHFCNANAPAASNFGFGRTISPKRLAQVSGSPAITTLTRGNGAVVSYLQDFNGVFQPWTTGLLFSLVTATYGGSTYLAETTNDGITTAYPYNASGVPTTIAFAQDAVGNTHTFAYSSCLLQSIMEGAGRKVTFAYNGSKLLTGIKDWANRLTTFSYGTSHGQNVLTEAQGPSGCITQHGYDSTARSNSITDPNGCTMRAVATYESAMAPCQQ